MYILLKDHLRYCFITISHMHFTHLHVYICVLNASYLPYAPTSQWCVVEFWHIQSDSVDCLSKMVVTCDIQFNQNECGTYFAGQLVDGSVVLEADKPKNVKGIVINMKIKQQQLEIKN